MDIRNLYEDAMNHLNSMSDEEFREISERAREESKYAYILDHPNENKLVIPFGNYEIVAEIPMFLQKFQMNCGSILEIRTIESFRIFVL